MVSACRAAIFLTNDLKVSRPKGSYAVKQPFCLRLWATRKAALSQLNPSSERWLPSPVDAKLTLAGGAPCHTAASNFCQLWSWGCLYN